MNTLVVGHYQKDTSWTENLPPGWQPWIITKDKDYPNVGREPASYLWAIQQAYRKIQPQQFWAFVQDDPFDHCPTLNGILQSRIQGYQWLGDATYNSGPDGGPHHNGLPVAEKYEAWTGRPFPGFVTFAAGGQFVVPGRALRRHPAKFYARLEQESLVGEVPWVLERLWEALLGGG